MIKTFSIKSHQSMKKKNRDFLYEININSVKRNTYDARINGLKSNGIDEMLDQKCTFRNFYYS